MSEAAIRSQIETALNTVADVGQVYDYDRHAVDWGEFLDLFKTKIRTKEQIRGWMIGYRGVPLAERESFRPGSKTGIARTHRFQIMGVMGIDDANESEKTVAFLCVIPYL